MMDGNPLINERLFRDHADARRLMTMGGTLRKTAMLLFIAVIPAATVYSMFAKGGAEAVMPYWMGGLLGGLVFFFITIFKKEWAPITAPLYAACEGLFLGAISAFFELQFQLKGIVMQAVLVTFGVFLMMLILYTSRTLRATPGFVKGVFVATLGIFFVYLASMLLRLFFGTTIPYIHESGWIGIGFSVFVVVIAALNLIIDFGMIEWGARSGAPKFMEWYGAFALMVTLVWLYIEVLKLLAKLRQR